MSIGARLRQEREKRSISLDEMASATEIRRDYLEALEGDAFDQLRGPAFGKLYIRAYAEKLGFDPAPLLEDYERAVRQRAAGRSSPKKKEPLRPVQSAVARWREARIAEQRTSEVVAEPEPPPSEPLEPEALEPQALESEPHTPEPLDAEPSEPAQLDTEPEPIETPVAPAEPAKPSRRLGRGLALVATALVLGVLAIRGFGRRGNAPAAPPVPAPVQTVGPATIEPTDHVVAAPQPTPAPTPTTRAADPSRLRVTESSIGRRVGGRFVAGGEFRKGQVAAFETRVVGGKRGDQIRHVWKWRGRRMQTITLRVGSSQWRTFSTKTLNGAGVWTVEAHDASGAVLASAEFVAGE